LTLEQLRIFVAVAEREHMTRAALVLNMTQSAASSAIASLETRHGVKLFDRLGRRISLNGTGKAFLSEAKAVLARSFIAEQVLADLAGLRTGALSLAASQTIGNYWLPPRLSYFTKRYPGLSIKLVIGNTQEVAALASEGEIDLGLVEGEVNDPTLSVIPIGEDELIVVSAPSQPVPLDQLDTKWLAGMPWVAREKGSGTRTAFETALKSLGIKTSDRHIALELPSNEAVRAAVEAGAGLALMSRLVVSASIMAGSLVALPFALRQRQFFLLRHKERYESQAARAFLQAIEDFALLTR
jgi:DNA-binding transcriptional LysR family regulator